MGGGSSRRRQLWRAAGSNHLGLKTLYGAWALPIAVPAASPLTCSCTRISPYIIPPEGRGIARQQHRGTICVFLTPRHEERDGLWPIGDFKRWLRINWEKRERALPRRLSPTIFAYLTRIFSCVCVCVF